MATDHALPPILAGTSRPISFAGMLRGEWLKYSRMQIMWWFSGGIAVLTLLRGLVLAPEAYFFHDAASRAPGASVPTSPALAYFIMQQAIAIVHDLSGFFIILVAVFMISREYQLGTIRVLLARGAGRLRLLGAKFLVLLLIGVASLVPFTMLITIMVVVASSTGLGNLDLLTNVPSYYWEDVGRFFLSILINLVVTALLATTLAVVGRTLAFGLSTALAYFFVENIVASILTGITSTTNNPLWYNISTFLLGVNLSQLGTALLPARNTVALISTGSGGSAFISGTVTIDAAHALIVIALYTAGLAALTITILLRRDVTQ